ncbi:MAG: class I SAM-dependent methyltransferase [bacterium]
MGQTLYDQLWHDLWGDLQSLGPVHRHLQEDLAEIVSSLQVRRVLEVGCGSGTNLAALAAAGNYELTGVDIAAEAVNLAKELVPQANLFLLDIEKAALPAQFDLVMSLQVVEHILDDVSALRNIGRMAKDFVLISTMQGKMSPSEIGIGHVRNYSTLELRRKLEAVGLEVIKVWGWGFPFYSPLYRTLAEWLPGGAPMGAMGRWQRFVARVLYHVYRLNWPGRGDVLFALARPRRMENSEP